VVVAEDLQEAQDIADQIIDATHDGLTLEHVQRLAPAELSAVDRLAVLGR
jgi:hypothetical protein